MNQSSYLYVLVRIRKSGSQSLVEMMSSALPASRLYAMPPVPPTSDLGIGWSEDFRQMRSTKKRLWKLFRTLDYSTAWNQLNSKATEGDIVTGHFHHGVPQLPNWNLRYITMVRDPVRRLFSEYLYYRESFLDRNLWRRFYLAERIKVAGTGSFNDYVGYLYKHRDRFANPAVGYITGGKVVSDPYDFLCKNYFHFGTLEKIGTFAEQLSMKLGSPSAPAWKNKTPGATGKTPEEHDTGKIQSLLGKDIELYEAIDRSLA
jgi:hypothetical protein